VKGLTISTFGGNPVAATAARAVLEYIEEQRLLANTAETGAYLRDRLLELQAKHPAIGDVRGMGLMQALELVEDRATKQPAPGLALQVMENARENRLLVGRGGLLGNVLRVTPPMNVGRADVDEFAARLDRSFAALG
jgi:4-aminobutyrate aminotransferase-like enzyme